MTNHPCSSSSSSLSNVYTIFLLILNFVVEIWAPSPNAAGAEQQIAHVAQQKADLATLKFVHLIWRHGARTPVTEMAKEPREWKQGPGELTRKGMGQLYRLGQWIRRRYDGGFLSPDYNSFETYVRSSDFNRTLMSAQALLAGLYPPRPERAFEPGLNWQPIPVHTESKETDRVIFDGTNCEPMAAEQKRVFDSAEVKEIEHRNADFLRFVALKSGFEQVPLPFRETRYVFDPLICIKFNGEGKKLPKWANESVIERIWQLHDISSSYLYSTTALVRFRAGVLFTEILQRMKNVQRGFGDNYDPRQRVHAYSAHDTTLAGILAAFGLPPSPFPHFATAIFVELHQAVHQQQQQPTNFIRLFYRNETDVDTLWELSIPNCPPPCTVDQLERVRAAILTTKEAQNRECAAATGSSSSSATAKFVWGEKINDIVQRHRELIYITLIGVLSLLCLSMCLYITCCSVVARCSRRRKKRQWKRRKMKWAHAGGGTASTTTLTALGQPLLPLRDDDDEDKDDDDDGGGGDQMGLISGHDEDEDDDQFIQ